MKSYIYYNFNRGMRKSENVRAKGAKWPKLSKRHINHRGQRLRHKPSLAFQVPIKQPMTTSISGQMTHFMP